MSVTQADPAKGAMVDEFHPSRWGDMQWLGRARTTGPNIPSLVAVGTLYSYRMAAHDRLYLVDGQIDHDWDFSPIRPHVHFSSDNGGSGNIVWELIYSHKTVSGTWSAEVTRSITWTGTLAAGAGAVADFWTGDGEVIANAGPSHLFRAQLRLVSKTFAGNVFLDGWDAHYRKNRAGTNSEFI